jgi:type IV secretory pathway TrbF-like protein
MIIDWKKWGVFGVIVVLALLCAVLAGVLVWRGQQGKATQAKVDVGQASAAADAGVAALRERSAVDQARAQIHINVKGGIDAIRSATGSDAQITPAARDAGLRALCGMRSYRGDAGCAALCGAAECERAAE